ncbi:MAG: hypothetical protein NTY20_03050 [Candidatus Aenigmarchaeota archaeon]|nr:hypothetical protein [Candidatus Aenigmarchaeota archaeon]
MKCNYIEGYIPLIDAICPLYHGKKLGVDAQYKKLICEAESDACTLQTMSKIVESNIQVLQKFDAKLKLLKKISK